MKRIKQPAAIALSVVAFSLASGAAADQGAERPFHAELVGFPNITTTPNPCLLLNRPTAEGTATHLGKATFSAEELINVCVFPTQITSSFVITGANGDEIHGSIDVVLIVSESPVLLSTKAFLPLWTSRSSPTTSDDRTAANLSGSELYVL